MPTMVDAWGVSAHCDVCNAEADENDLEDDSAARMACGHCREVVRDLSVALIESKEGPD